MKKFKKLSLLLIIILSVCSSCVLAMIVTVDKYKITKHQIKSNHSFYQGFEFSELSVDSLDTDGIPFKFTKKVTVSLDMDDEDGNKSKKIKFYESNKNYSWSYLQTWDIPILPIKMKPNNWYLIEGLIYLGNPDLSIFIYIDENGNSTQYSKPIKTNW